MKKATKPNPKKNKADRRKRNPLEVTYYAPQGRHGLVYVRSKVQPKDPLL